jgi:hypothetical protein
MIDYIYPFRRAILELLSPYDLINLRASTCCTYSESEEKRYLAFYKFIFNNSKVLDSITSSGKLLLIVGKDLLKLQELISNPASVYSSTGKKELRLNLMIVESIVVSTFVDSDLQQKLHDSISVGTFPIRIQSHVCDDTRRAHSRFYSCQHTGSTPLMSREDLEKLEEPAYENTSAYWNITPNFTPVKGIGSTAICIISQNGCLVREASIDGIYDHAINQYDTVDNTIDIPELRSSL